MALSYEFSIGSVRAKEKNLFTNSDIEHMLGCENVNELCRYLSVTVNGVTVRAMTLKRFLKSHSENVWEYLKRTAPDFAIFKPFFYLNDLHVNPFKTVPLRFLKRGKPVPFYRKTVTVTRLTFTVTVTVPFLRVKTVPGYG